MNLNIYKKTRIQGVYQHIKNKNYAIEVSKPYKTSISRINGEKIYDKELVKDIIANPDKYINKKIDKELLNKYKIENKNCTNEFDLLWNKYINWCIYVKKYAYNTINLKNKMYTRYFKNKFEKKICKLTTEFLADFLISQNTTDKQKNEMLKQLKCFFNWCIHEEKILKFSPVNEIKKIHVEKSPMKFWTPEESRKFQKVVLEDIKSKDKKTRRKAYLVYVLTKISLSDGKRIGESRALFYTSYNAKDHLLAITNSINYDKRDNKLISTTKTKKERYNIATDNIIELISKYKEFLETEYDKEISDDTLIIYNHQKNKPYSDTTLRKHFYYYCDKANVKKIRMYDLRHPYVKPTTKKFTTFFEDFRAAA